MDSSSQLPLWGLFSEESPAWHLPWRASPGTLLGGCTTEHAASLVLPHKMLHRALWDVAPLQGTFCQHPGEWFPSKSCQHGTSLWLASSEPTQNSLGWSCSLSKHLCHPVSYGCTLSDSLDISPGEEGVSQIFSFLKYPFLFLGVLAVSFTCKSSIL